MCVRWCVFKSCLWENRLPQGVPSGLAMIHVKCLSGIDILSGGNLSIWLFAGRALSWEVCACSANQTTKTKENVKKKKKRQTQGHRCTSTMHEARKHQKIKVHKVRCALSRSCLRKNRFSQSCPSDFTRVHSNVFSPPWIFSCLGQQKIEIEHKVLIK